MKVILQRVKEASVTTDNHFEKIDKGLLLFVGISNDTTVSDIEVMAKKIPQARIFEDDEQKMNLSLKDINGSILSISQFTLCATVKKGNRPSFTQAMHPEKAEKLYQLFNQCLTDQHICVKQGVFGADMDIQLINDGPVTLIYEAFEGRIL